MHFRRSNQPNDENITLVCGTRFTSCKPIYIEHILHNVFNKRITVQLQVYFFLTKIRYKLYLRFI
jgi:hypothetical protein